MFEIMDGRGSFWQWDLNQKLVVQDLPNGAEVHFSNCNSDYALVTPVKTVGGKNVCDVPNVVLQKAGYVNVFAYVIEGEEKHTEYKASILILARSKPEDYIYTETETLCYKNLSEKIGDVSRLETDAKENLVDAVNEIAKKAASGADLSLGITGAEAGQIATVEAVDDQGKPTKWKHENIAGAVGFQAPTVSDNGKYLGCENGKAEWLPVEASGGGATEGTWELINSIEISETVNTIMISADKSGNHFSLKRAIVVCELNRDMDDPFTFIKMKANRMQVCNNQTANKTSEKLYYCYIFEHVPGFGTVVYTLLKDQNFNWVFSVEKMGYKHEGDYKEESINYIEIVANDGKKNVCASGKIDVFGVRA